MPTFTIELYRVIEERPKDKTVAEWLGLDTYPIHDESYRETLNSKIIDHYLNREIGTESVDMFRHAVRRKMNLIMPIYVEYYKLADKKYDPLINMDLTTNTVNESTGSSSSESESNSTGSTEAKARAVSSEMPQMMLKGDADYATSASDTNSQNESDSQASELSTGTTTDNDTGESTTRGLQGSATDLLVAYRESLLNIDEIIITELSDCFMLVWNNGDEYTTSHDIYDWF